MATGRRPVGFAVVGLGHIAQSQVLPAFERTEGKARLVALVSGDERKSRALASIYGIGKCFSYDRFDDCLADEEVEAVYIALPNDLHRPYVERAARAGVHVLCEKPLALSEADCRAMIDACATGGVELMTAYRLHFEEANLRAVDWVRRRRIGEPRVFSSLFGYQVEPGNIRTSAERGGGPAWDLGIYCVNAARSLFGDEPVEVFAEVLGGDARFRDVEAAMGALLRFPGERIAQFSVSFDTAPVAHWRMMGTEGELELVDAYEYAAPRKLTLRRDDDVVHYEFGVVDQFAPELAHFADCIREGRRPIPDGEEGLRDVRIVEALHRSARERRPIALPSLPGRLRPDPSLAIHVPPGAVPPLVEAEAPSQ